MTREEYMLALAAYTADKTDDETLDFLHTATEFADSIDELIATARKEEDTRWRERYRRAFFGGVDKEEEKDKDITPDIEIRRTVDDIVTDRDRRYF